ncbi:MAG: hypothetical protein ABII90_02475 [Bacteroidota bacterium]
MKRHITYIITCLIYCNSYSQTEYSLSNYITDSASFLIGATGEYSLNSTVLNNEFYSAFIKGSYIDTETKDRISKKLSVSNRIGGDIDYGIYFAHKIDSLLGKAKPGLNFFINLSNREHLDANFSQYLFNLCFYGNKMFAGQAADLGNSNLNLLRYQQLELGLINGNSSGKIFGLGISFLKAEEHFFINTGNTELFTSQTGDSLDLDMNLQLNRSDTGNMGLEAFNGWGLSTGLIYQFPYDLFHRKNNNDSELGTNPDGKRGRRGRQNCLEWLFQV